MFLLAGLGNKGKKYLDTRHNVGFNVIDKLIAQYEFKTEKKNLNSHTFRGIINENKIILLKPMTFMNNSGKSVLEISSFYKIPKKKIFIIHDDVDLSVARVKVKCGGSDGGHNGIKSIDRHIANDYYRIRIGIGKPDNFIQVKDYVLKKFTTYERNKVNKKTDILIKNISYLLKYDINNFLNVVSRD